MFDVERLAANMRIDKGIHADVVLERDGIRSVIAESVDAASVAELAAGRSSRLIESHVGRVPPEAPRRAEVLTVIEGHPPRRLRRHPPADGKRRNRGR
jgi:hypothetical protein